MSHRIHAAVACMLLITLPSWADDVDSLLAKIKAVGKEGAGNVDAKAAWKELVGKGPEVLPRVLAGFGDASPVAANWMRQAVETVAENTLAAGKPLNAAQLESFVRDQKQTGAARRLAYEYLRRVDSTADRLLTVDDSGPEMRRDAVDQLLIKKADALFKDKDEKAARAAYEKAFEHARDLDQVKHVAERLSKLGQNVDLNTHLGFVMRWAITGPFDNVKGVGFNAVYPPERGVDLKTTYTDKDSKKAKWEETTTTAKFGLVDINKVVAPLHGAVCYAYTVVSSPQDRPIEIRAGSNNAVRIWLNGKEVYSREEYHHGFQVDQHVGKGTLKAGRNEILVKVLQNEQTDSWAQQWSFQLRLCDHLGGAVPFDVVLDKLPERKGGDQ